MRDHPHRVSKLRSTAVNLVTYTPVADPLTLAPARPHYVHVRIRLRAYVRERTHSISLSSIAFDRKLMQ